MNIPERAVGVKLLNGDGSFAAILQKFPDLPAISCWQHAIPWRLLPAPRRAVRPRVRPSRPASARGLVDRSVPGRSSGGDRGDVG
jgi:hypothetical protein